MRILVTGASGVIAQVILPTLATMGDVVALDLKPPKESLSGVEYIVGSICSSDIITQSLDRCTHVVHLARGKSDDWNSLHQVDIGGTRTVLSRAASLGIQRIIVASSNNVMGAWEADLLSGRIEIQDSLSTTSFHEVRPNSEYAVAKLFAENYARHISETTDTGISCIRFGAVRLCDDFQAAADEPGFDWIPGGRAGVLNRLKLTWLSHEDARRIVGEELRANEKFRLRLGVSESSNSYWPKNIVIG